MHPKGQHKQPPGCVIPSKRRETCTHLLFPLLNVVLSVLGVGLVEAIEANADRAGSWSDELLPFLCCEYWADAVVDADEGRDISCPRDGRVGRSSSD